jgi:hypothetical protein
MTAETYLQCQKMHRKEREKLINEAGEKRKEHLQDFLPLSSHSLT